MRKKTYVIEKTIKNNSFIFLILSVIFIIFSCSKQEGIDKNDLKKYDITVSVGGSPSSLDPAFAKGLNTAVYINHLFETLTKRDEKGNIIPSLAESYSHNEDNTVYIFNIRDNAKWSDGKDITASDFVYTLRRLIDPKVASPFSHGFDVIKNAKNILEGKMNIEELGVKALDDKTISIELEYSLPYFEEAMASDIASPVREDIINRYGESWALNAESYICNGPYVLKEFSPDLRLVIQKNENYYDKNNVIANTITFSFLEDVNTALSAIYRDDILFFPDVPENERESLINKGIGHEVDITSICYYLINLNKKPFNNPLVRRAISLAIDRDYIVKNIMKGGRVAADGFVPINVKNGTNDFRKYAPKYFEVDEEYYKDNVREAKKLLSLAGYNDMTKFPVIELITTQNPSSLFMAEAIQDMLKNNLGITMKIRFEEPTTYLQSVIDGSFQMIKASTSVAYNQATGYLRLFQIDGLGNSGGYSNILYDSLVYMAMTNDNEEVRIRKAYEAEAVLIKDDMAVIPLYYDKATVMQSKKLLGVGYDIFSIYDFRKCYIDSNL